MGDENGRFQWLKDELAAMEGRLTLQIRDLRETTTARLNDHAIRLKAVEKAEDQEAGARRYKRWLVATSFALVGAIGTIVGIVATVRGGSP